MAVEIFTGMIAESFKSKVLPVKVTFVMERYENLSTF